MSDISQEGSVSQHSSVETTDDWRPTCTLQALRVRAVMLQAVREFFQQHSYLEVETPLLSQDIVVDAHLHPFAVPVAGGIRYLQTSPEAGMKRLLAAGSGSIFQVTRSFRCDESGARHNPEFTMLEWYGVGSDHHQQMQFTEQLVRRCLAAAETLTARGVMSAYQSTPFRRILYDAAFQRSLGQSVIDCSATDLLHLAQTRGVQLPDSLDRDSTDEILNLLLAICVEPELGYPVPEFVFGYPATQAALARVCETDHRIADRFELYVNGVELCNGYYELTDAVELRRRDLDGNCHRIRQDQPALPGADRMLQAMRSGLPECAGVALGFDRLVMLALEATSIDEVIPFPFARA